MRAVNLIPSEDRRGAAVGAGRSQGAAYAVLGVLGGLAILALLYGIANHQATSRRSQLASLAARTQRAQESATQLTPYTSFIALREQRMQAVVQLVDSRFDWAHALHELGRVLPHDAAISSLDGTIGSGSSSTAAASTSSAPSATAAAGAAVSSSTPPGSVPTFTLSGCATSQSEVALTIQRLRLIDGVSDVSLQSSTRSASSGSSASSSGSCGEDKPTFTVQITFAPLPAASATASVTKLTRSTGAAE
jgi:Tfp pilus assembly protein PilN